AMAPGDPVATDAAVTRHPRNAAGVDLHVVRVARDTVAASGVDRVSAWHGMRRVLHVQREDRTAETPVALVERAGRGPTGPRPPAAGHACRRVSGREHRHGQ